MNTYSTESSIDKAFSQDETGDTDVAQWPSNEIVIGTLVSIDEQGQPLVSYNLGKAFASIPALATVLVTAQHIGRQVGLLFAKSNLNTPVLIGYIHSPLHGLLDNIEIAELSDEEQDAFVEQSASSEAVQDNNPLEKNENNNVIVDGNRVILEGKDEVVLKCGEASISLNKNGKIAIRGKYLLNRSTGVNRIVGGSVQVN